MVASTFCCYYVRDKKTNLAAFNNQAKVEKLKMKMYEYHSIDAGVCWGTSEEILPQFPISPNNSSLLSQFTQSTSVNCRFNQAKLTPTIQGGAR